MRLLFALFAFLNLAASDYKFEGIWEDCYNRRPFFISFFLPYNPTILSYDPNPEIRTQCTQFWPKANFFYAHDDPKSRCDLLWIDNERMELIILQDSKALLQTGAFL